MLYLPAVLQTFFFIRMKKIKMITLGIILLGISNSTTSQNKAPELDAGATIRQAYCPKTQIVIAPDFTITDADDSGIDAFSIQISSGYSRNTDRLSLTGTHSTIDDNWSEVEGKLKLTPKEGTQILYTAIQKAVREIVFESSSNTVNGEKDFSFTIGAANYLPSTEHFYVFEPDLNITWTDAKAAAEIKTYYGLQGYLATILSAEENQISAEQITGTGWIGANDADEEGVWNWVTGPEAVTNFWNGTFTGTPATDTNGNIRYSNWNTSPAEPNQSGNEDYAHITDNSIGLRGSWNDLSNEGGGGPYQAKGYIVEYGGMPGDPILNISASTSIYIPKIVSVNNIEVCSNSSVILTATATEGTVFWYDAITGGNLLETGNTFTTPVLTNSKTYYAAASPEGCETSDRLAAVVTVYAVPVANNPVDNRICDDDGDGFYNFNFDTDTTPQILNDQAITEFEVLYFNKRSDAEANVAGSNITSPYTNTTAFTLETIYARIHNKNDNSCSAIVAFNLFVSETPIPTQPVPYRVCDNLESTSDTDGIITTFLLNTRDSEILGSLDANQYNISYHSTQNGADTNAPSTVIDKDSNHSVTDFQTVYIRIENKDNTTCYDAFKTLELFVDPLPTVTAVAQLKQCDTDADKQTTFNLTEAWINISNNLENQSFKYFPTEIAAINGAPEVADKTSYFVNTTGEAWVRTISNENCYRISKIELTVSYTPNEPYQEIFISCDDFLDTDGNDTVTNSDTDGITYFNFSIATSEITNDEDVVVEFYETEKERTQSINEIQLSQNIANYRNVNIPNNTGSPFPIYYKLISKSNNDCQGLGQIYLQIDPVPIANSVDDIELCDDLNDGNSTNGILQTFNLESQKSTILGNQNTSDFTVTYHLSATDANSGNAPLASLYTNTNRDLQTIFVRVTNNETDCYTDHSTFNLIVHPLPIANFVDDLEVCDDNSDGSARNGFSQTIDLESQTSGIIGTQDPAIYSVTYHRDLNEAQNGLNPLVSPFSNNTVNRQTIFVRVFNSDTQCANGISNFDVLVNPEPTFETISNLSECDNNDDLDDTNGIIQTIDLDGKIAEILGTSQDPGDYIVTFHLNASFTDAPIVSPYTNTNPLETIYVRIQNKVTSCVNDDATFDVIVNTLPNFTVTSPQILCLNDTPKNIAIENPFAIYSYVWKDASGNKVGEDDNLNVTSGGNYTVTATTTNGTSCSRAKTIAVTESSPAILLNSFVTIVDEANTLGSENNLSISIDTISNDLGPGDYQFAILNTDDDTRTPFVGFQDQPLFENLEGGIYTIIVNDKNGCAPDATLQISVLQFPKFFTPNGDGKNDTWLIKGANKTFYPNSSINIFNRFGKLVAQIPIDGQGWNGTYNSKRLSSDDYWYTIILIPANTSKPTINKTGNFSLIRK
jgi:gliding motility-associated-like protein